MSREEVERHIHDALDRYQVAEELLRGGYPADAANRLYYSLFHAASSLVLMQGHRPRTHRGLYHVLMSEFASKGELPDDLLFVFRQVQTLREEADYNVMVRIDPESVEVLLEQGERFLDFVQDKVTKMGSPRSND